MATGCCQTHILHGTSKTLQSLPAYSLIKGCRVYKGAALLVQESGLSGPSSTRKQLEGGGADDLDSGVVGGRRLGGITLEGHVAKVGDIRGSLGGAALVGNSRHVRRASWLITLHMHTTEAHLLCPALERLCDYHAAM